MNGNILPLSEYPSLCEAANFVRAAGAIVMPVAVAVQTRVVDAFSLRYETGSSVGNSYAWLQKVATGQAGSIAVTSATWNNTAKTLTKTGAFAAFAWREGQVGVVVSGTGWTAGAKVRISGRTSDDAVTLTNLDGTAISITGSSDVAINFFTGVPLSGMGTGGPVNPQGSVVAGIPIDNGSGEGFPNTVLAANILASDPGPQAGVAGVGPRNVLAAGETLQLVTNVTPTALAEVSMSLHWRTKRN